MRRERPTTKAGDPRGLSAIVDEWLKDVAPPPELRFWYGHDVKLFPEFRRRYLVELAEPRRADAVDHLRARKRDGPLTLLTATRDLEHSHVTVLAESLPARITPK